MRHVEVSGVVMRSPYSVTAYGASLLRPFLRYSSVGFTLRGMNTANATLSGRVAEEVRVLMLRRRRSRHRHRGSVRSLRPAWGFRTGEAKHRRIEQKEASGSWRARTC